MALGERAPEWRFGRQFPHTETKPHLRNAALSRNCGRHSMLRGGDQTAWLGRQDSNLRIRNPARFGLPLSCGVKSGSRSCAGLQQAHARLPSPQGTTAVKPARHKFLMQRGSNPAAPASQSGLHRLTCECRSKWRGTAAFRGYGVVSVCGIWRWNRRSGLLSPRATFWYLVFDGRSYGRFRTLRSRLSARPSSIRVVGPFSVRDYGPARIAHFYQMGSELITLRGRVMITRVPTLQATASKKIFDL
jgi:hypothetical protein